MHAVFDGVIVKFQGHLPQHLRIPVFKKQNSIHVDRNKFNV